MNAAVLNPFGFIRRRFRQWWQARLPLSDTLTLCTYVSELRTPTGTEWTNRSSIWDCTSGHWQLRFHQGTPHP